MELQTLQIIWFALLIILFTGYIVLDGLDLGAGIWHFFFKKDSERRLVLKSIAPIWDGNEVWLITGGAGIFAAFPALYSTIFSTFYLAVMLILLGLIFRAVAIEFRNKHEDTWWHQVWDWAFIFGSGLPAVLFGVALGNLLVGLNIDATGNYLGSFFDLLTPFSLAVGVLGFLMFCFHGGIYLGYKLEKDKYQMILNKMTPLLVTLILMIILIGVWLGISYLRTSHFFVFIAFLAGAILAFVFAQFSIKNERTILALISSSLGLILVFWALALNLFPEVVWAVNNPSFSLSIYNSSASEKTLNIMLLIAVIGMPIVIGYTCYVYRIFAGKTKSE